METNPAMTPSTLPSPPNSPNVEQPKVSTTKDLANTQTVKLSVKKASDPDTSFAEFSAERKSR